MKIYFCDICNESIPLPDLETGKAITVKGKVLCKNCNPVAGTKAAASVGQSGGGPARVGILVLVLALGGAGAMGWFLRRERDDRLVELRGEIERGQAAVRSELGRRGEDFVVRLDRARESQVQSAQAAEETSRRIDREISGMKERLDGFQGYIRETEERKRRVEELEIAQTAAMDSLRGLQASVDDLRRTFESLPSGSALVMPAPTPGEASGAAASPSADAIPPGIQALLAKLKDADAGVRWGAVTDLAQTGDPRVVPHLVPLLADEDSFVRHNVALTLGELDARSAVPALIDALSDEQAIVRDSAITALRRLTHQNLKFDPYGRRDERDRQLRAWRSWWDSNGGRFLEGK